VLTGQTETTACVGNPPGRLVEEGALGVPLPGYAVMVDGPDGPVDPALLPDGASVEGELCLRTTPTRPLGLMVGYLGDVRKTAAVLGAGLYRTGDVVRATGGPAVRLAYVARADDVFKSAGYRISPFELESALMEHPPVAEVAVVASPDPVRTAVPKGSLHVLWPGSVHALTYAFRQRL
jgi:acetyl-CoA synthetase